MSDINDWLYCTVCKRPYSNDVLTPAIINVADGDGTDGGEPLNLSGVIPVQSVACSHVLCLSCVQQQASNLATTSNDPGGSRIIPCPKCGADGAFDADNPIVSAIAFDILNDLQTSVRPNTNGNKHVSKPEKEISGQSEISVNDIKKIYMEHNQPQDVMLSGVDTENGSDTNIDGSQQPETDTFLDDTEGNAEESIDSTTEKANRISQNSEHNAVLPARLPGAFSVQGFVEDIPETPDEELQVAEARRIDEIPTVHAEALVQQVAFWKRYRYVLIPIFSILIILLFLEFLLVIVPQQIRENKLLAIVLNVSNQTSVRGLGVPQTWAKNWVLGLHNYAYDPTRDREQIAQRYVFATLCWSLGCENFSVSPADNECNWLPELLHCSSDGKVTNLTFVNKNLVGTLQSEVGYLKTLKILNLKDNSISGTLPSTIGKLTELEVLNLSNNSLSGVIPTQVRHLTQVVELMLQENELVEAIPVEVSYLSQLETLNLSINKLSGSIPSDLGKLSLQQNLGLSNNFFTGTIPAELGLLTELQSLELDRNLLEGTVPSTLSLPQTLKRITLFGNANLSGDVSYLCAEGNREVIIGESAENLSCSCCSTYS